MNIESRSITESQESPESLENSAEIEQTDEEALARLESEQSETPENESFDTSFRSYLTFMG